MKSRSGFKDFTKGWAEIVNSVLGAQRPQHCYPHRVAVEPDPRSGPVRPQQQGAPTGQDGPVAVGVQVADLAQPLAQKDGLARFAVDDVVAGDAVMGAAVVDVVAASRQQPQRCCQRPQQQQQLPRCWIDFAEIAPEEFPPAERIISVPEFCLTPVQSCVGSALFCHPILPEPR